MWSSSGYFQLPVLRNVAVITFLMKHWHEQLKRKDNMFSEVNCKSFLLCCTKLISNKFSWYMYAPNKRNSTNILKESRFSYSSAITKKGRLTEWKLSGLETFRYVLEWTALLLLCYIQGHKLFPAITQEENIYIYKVCFNKDLTICSLPATRLFA